MRAEGQTVEGGPPGRMTQWGGIPWPAAVAFIDLIHAAAMRHHNIYLLFYKIEEKH